MWKIIKKGYNKECKNCKELKDISLFERPYLNRCIKCAYKKPYERKHLNFKEI